MGRRFVPLVVVAAVLAFAVAAASAGYTLQRPLLWGASVALVVLGGITPLIYAVNARILPVFSGRQWPRPNLLYASMVLAVAGAWMVYAGRALPDDLLERAGSGAALAGGLLFVSNVIWLFRRPKTASVVPPLPFPQQAAIDRIGTSFMRLAAIYLLAGLATGLLLTFWTPSRGRWDLVWAHLMLVGWFVSMASGVLYHVLPRWTGERWRRPELIRVHLFLVVVGLPLMVLALALDLDALFAVAGPLQAAAVLLMIWNIAPLAWRLPATSRYGVVAAAFFLAVGVSLGASVAMDPVNHVHLRFTHAQVNLFGWGGLLVSAVGYYLFPRFAGQPLRWPRLAGAQLVVQAAGVTLSAVSWWWYLAVDMAAEPLITAGTWMVAGSMLVFAASAAATFMKSSRATVSSLTVRPLPSASQDR